MTRLGGLLAALGVTAAAAFGLPQAAVAAPRAAALPVLQDSQAGMYMAGFDAAVARAHGYKIVTYANGDQQSVPIDSRSTLPRSAIVHRQSASTGSASAATLRTAVGRSAALASNTDYNSVQGNCGVSWIRVTQTGTNKVAVVSGFRNTPEPADFWIWQVSLTDRNGTSHQNYEHAILGTQASRLWQNLNQFGYTYDFVSKGGATLIDGTICLSGRPDVYISL